jgi:N utilization substance protein B
MGLRRRSREAAIKIIYQVEMSGYPPEDCLKMYWENNNEGEGIKEFANFLVRGVFAHLDDIDQKVGKISSNWPIKRMHKVDLNILRLAVFEMYYTQGIPHKVSINEAIELAKKFGTEESKTFVNGILGRLFDNINPQGDGKSQN